MKRGERILFGALGILVVGAAVRAWLHRPEAHEREIPFFSTAPAALAQSAGDIIRGNRCRDCHSLWTTRTPLQSVPAPMLDGIGALRSEAWLFDYLSSSSPQAILPSRLKAEYRMPSFASLPIAQRRDLAAYLASLQVKDWYLDQTRRLEHDKLTGEDTAER